MFERKSRLYGYLAGQFVTSLGSLAYAAILPALLFQQGIETGHIGALIGCLRISTFFVNYRFGHIGDRKNPLHVMLVCEAGAAIGSGLILISWFFSPTLGLVPFFLANLFRTFFTALQAGSVQKFAKTFDDEAGLKGQLAVRLNSVVNGALFIAAAFGMVFFDRLTVQNIVLFDAATFLANGALLFLFQDGRFTSRAPMPKQNASGLGGNVKKYQTAMPHLMLADALLSLALCGSNTLNLRLLSNRPAWIPLLPAVFGGCAVLAPIIAKKSARVPSLKLIWLILAGSLLAQGLFNSMPVIVLGLSVVRNLAYWTVYNTISQELMANAPADSFSGIVAGRNAVNTGILAAGEGWVGATKSIPIWAELLWRSIVATASAGLTGRRRS